MLSQTPAIGPGTDALPEPSTLKLSLSVDEATAGSPHSNTVACGVAENGAQRTKALRLMAAPPVGSDAGIDVEVSRCAPKGSDRAAPTRPKRSIVYETPVTLEDGAKAAMPSASEPEKAKARLSTGPSADDVGAQPSEDETKTVPEGQLAAQVETA